MIPQQQRNCRHQRGESERELPLHLIISAGSCGDNDYVPSKLRYLRISRISSWRLAIPKARPVQVLDTYIDVVLIGRRGSIPIVRRFLRTARIAPIVMAHLHLFASSHIRLVAHPRDSTSRRFLLALNAPRNTTRFQAAGQAAMLAAPD
jgi:hypothetical protein